MMMRKKLKRGIQHIIGELDAYVGNPEKPELENILVKLADSKPDARLDPAFKAKLRKKIFAVSNTPEKQKSGFFSPRRLMLAASIFSVALVIVMLPVLFRDSLFRSAKSDRAPSEAFADNSPLPAKQPDATILQDSEAESADSLSDNADLSGAAQEKSLYKARPVEKKELAESSEPAAARIDSNSRTEKLLDLSEENGRLDSFSDVGNEGMLSDEPEQDEAVLPSHMSMYFSEQQNREINDSPMVETEDGGTLKGKVAPSGPAGAESSAVPADGKRAYAADSSVSTASAGHIILQSGMSEIAKYLENGELPPAESISVLHTVNSFFFGMPNNSGNKEVSVYAGFSECPWNRGHLLMMLCVRPGNGQWNKLDISFDSALISKYRLTGSGPAFSARKQLTISNPQETDGQRISVMFFELVPVSDSIDSLADNKSAFFSFTLEYEIAAKNKTSLLKQSDPAMERIRLADVSADFRFASAIAWWSLILSESDEISDSGIQDVYDFASSDSAAKSGGQKEFLELLKRSLEIQKND